MFRTTQETCLSIYNYSNGLWEKKLNIPMVYGKKIKKRNTNGCKWREWQQTQMDDNISQGPSIFFKIFLQISCWYIVQSWIWTLIFQIIEIKIKQLHCECSFQSKVKRPPLVYLKVHVTPCLIWIKVQSYTKLQSIDKIWNTFWTLCTHFHVYFGIH